MRYRPYSFICLVLASTAGTLCSLDTAFHPVTHRAQSSSLSLPFFKHFYNQKEEQTVGAHIKCTAFFNKTFDAAITARGLTGQSNETVSIGPGTTNYTVDSKHLVHMINSEEHPFAQLRLSPQERTYGFHLDWYHDLDLLINGLFIHLNLTGMQKKTDLLDASKYSELFSDTNKIDATISVKEFFEGTTQPLAEELKYGKIFKNQQSKYGIEEVSGRLGWHFVDTNTLRLTLFATARIPSGDMPEVENLFAPRVGWRHYTFGTGLSGHIVFADDGVNQWQLEQSIYGAYSLANDDIRIPYIKDLAWGHYYQAQKNGTASGIKVAPLINLIPKVVDVHPGAHGQTRLNISYRHKNFVVDAGCQATYQEAENNSLAAPLEKDTYALVNTTINPANYSGSFGAGKAFTIGGTFPETADEADRVSQEFRVINNDDLILNYPTLLIHNWFVSIGSIYKPTDKSWHIGGSVGASVEFAHPEEVSIRSFRLWTSCAASF